MVLRAVVFSLRVLEMAETLPMGDPVRVVTWGSTTNAPERKSNSDSFLS